MKRILSILFIAFFTANCYSQNEEKKQIENCFRTYKDAILTNQGKIAVNSVDDKTIKYYTEILEKIKKTDSITLDGLGIIDKFSVLTFKHRASKKEILSFDGKDLFEFAIEKGMVGKNSVKNTSIGEISIDGNFARGQLISNGQETSSYFTFYKENNNWKINITSMLSAGVKAFNLMIKDSGKTENDFIIDILEIVTGKKPGNEIWHPLI